jgi:acyl-CoA synthetase (AMP-forming)/AMP-acid ligase II
MFGQAVTMLLVPLIPAEAVFMRGYSPHEIVRQIRSRRISLAAVVPKLLEVLRDHVLQQFPGAAEPPPPGTHWTRRWWRYRRIHRYFGLKFWVFISGAAPLEAELEEFWSSLGFLVVQVYGLTETAPIVSFNNPFAVRKGTVGRPVEGTEIKIAADGEVMVRGDSVTQSYFGAPAETGSAFTVRVGFTLAISARSTTPERHTKLQWFGNSFLYWLLALLFNAFPLPQTETGASGSLRYLGDLVSGGWSVLFFPEGERTEAGEIHPFQPGIGLIASRLRVPIVPVRLRGVETILHRGQYFPRPGRVEVTFGRLHLSGEDYPALARQVERAVREL